MQTYLQKLKNLNNDITNALCNAIDIKKTIESNGLNNIKRVHGGTDNEDNLKDLIDDVIYFLEQLNMEVEE